MKIEQLIEIKDHPEFRDHVRIVFRQLYEIYDIYFSDIIQWLNMPSKQYIFDPDMKLYEYNYPCNERKLMNKYNIEPMLNDYESDVFLVLVVGSKLYIKGWYSDGAKFSIYDFAPCLRESYNETIKIFEDILNGHN